MIKLIIIFSVAGFLGRSCLTFLICWALKDEEETYLWDRRQEIQRLMFLELDKAYKNVLAGRFNWLRYHQLGSALYFSRKLRRQPTIPSFWVMALRFWHKPVIKELTSYYDPIYTDPEKKQ